MTKQLHTRPDQGSTRLNRYPALLMLVLVCALAGCAEPELTEREQRIFASLSLARLAPPNTESNRFAGDAKAAALGEQLFHDAQLSSTGNVSCATCHIPEQHFVDGLPKARGIGQLNRNTPSLAGAAWHQWQYWDGRRDSLWSQALSPLEAKEEMGSNRVAIARLMLENADYKQQYEALFGPLIPALSAAQLAIDASPIGSDAEKRAWFELDTNAQEWINTVFANVGKSIGAFEQTLPPPRTRFDRFVDTVVDGAPDFNLLAKDELRGARLFINEEKTQCLECHNGPLLSNGDFHNIGTGRFNAAPGEQLDFGRIFGVQAALINEFNCQGRYSDATRDGCQHLRFLNRGALSHMQGAFRTPTLRNVPNTAPYFHDGRLASLRQVVQHYATQPVATESGQNELRAFPLTNREIDQLTAFLDALIADDEIDTPATHSLLAVD